MNPDKHPVSANSQSQRGVTLVELMVAMAISLIVLLAVGTVYFSTRRTYSVQQAFSQMQENALYAFQTLSTDISAAGYAGCSLSFSNPLNLSGLDSNMYDFTTGVYGWEFAGTAPGSTAYTIPTPLAVSTTAGDWTNFQKNTLDTDIAKYAIPGSDVLVVISSQQTPLIPASQVNHGATSINVGQQTNIPAGKIMIISNCRTADVFQNVTDGTGSNTTVKSLDLSSGSISQDYNNPQDTKIYESTSRVYFVGLAVNGQPALFRYDLDKGQPATPQELVEGVENMQVLYGQDVGGDDISANHYVPINQVTDPHKIYAVRVSLLMRSDTVDRPKPTVAPQEVLGAAGETVTIQTPIDQRMRKVFTTTIALRNMQIQGR